MRRIVQLLSLTLFLGCLKDPKPLPTELPPVTQTGANTFGCKIDGQIFVPEKGDFTGPMHVTVLNLNFPDTPYHQIQVFAKRVGNVEFGGSIHFLVKDVKTIGSYNLGYINNAKEFISYGSVASNGYYETDTINGGGLTITRLDSINKIVSGTFYFNAVDKNGKIVKVTEGRFDLKE